MLEEIKKLTTARNTTNRKKPQISIFMDLFFISYVLSLHLTTLGVGDKVLALGMAAGMESARSSQGCSAMYPLQDTAVLTSEAGGASVKA